MAVGAGAGADFATGVGAGALRCDGSLDIGLAAERGPAAFGTSNRARCVLVSATGVLAGALVAGLAAGALAVGALDVGADLAAGARATLDAALAIASSPSLSALGAGVGDDNRFDSRAS